MAGKKRKFEDKINLASSYESIGNHLHALQIYTALIETDESCTEAYIRLAQLYEKTGRIKEAEKVLDQMISVSYDNDYGLIFFCEFLMRHSKWEKALNITEKIDATVYPIAHYWKGFFNYQIRKLDQARNALEHLRKIDNNFDYWRNALFLLAHIEFDSGNYQEALNHAQKVEYVYSDNWELFLLLSKIYLKLDMIMHAEEKISKALKFSGNNAKVFETAAMIYYKSGKLKRAEKYYEILLGATDEISAEVYSTMASIAEANKELEKAKLYYELALKIDSGYQPAITALNWIMMQNSIRANNE